MILSEKQIQDSIIELLRAKGCYVLRCNSGKVQNALTGTWLELAPKGTSDLIGADTQGRIFFIEVKSATGTLDVEQIRFLREQHKAGRRWAVCMSYENALQFLVDESYHGEEKHTRNILHEDKMFIPTQIKRTRTQKMSLSTFLEYDTWKRKTDGV